MPLIESLLFLPRTRPFRPEEIEAEVMSMPFSLRAAAGIYLLCGSAHATQYARVALLEGSGDTYPAVAVVRVSADDVRLGQRCTDDALRQARALAEWLRRAYDCAIYGDGIDYTDATRETVAPLYS